ncbi:MAG: class I SAM-dependent methyltransferase [Beijerinckiaceae bacterium]|nr:class I SAM-dependent methyltransferase [Beijerinckiaceae bacterium]
MKNHFGNAFFGVKDFLGFFNGVQKAIHSVDGVAGTYTGDNLFTFHKNLSFLDDLEFVEAHSRHAVTEVEKSTIWRAAVVLWGFRHGLKLEGDFIECACYRGTTARIICDVVKFEKFLDRKYYLYDLFDHNPGLAHHAMPAHSKTLFREVRQRFSDCTNVMVNQGEVPAVLKKNSPSKIAFLHLDLNNKEAELAALEILFPRIVPGAIIVLDDYGWLGYREQRLAEEPWFAERGCSVLELPTGQGLVIR